MGKSTSSRSGCSPLKRALLRIGNQYSSVPTHSSGPRRVPPRWRYGKRGDQLRTLLASAPDRYPARDDVAGPALAKENFGFRVAVLRHCLDGCGGVSQLDSDDLGAAQRHHGAAVALVHRINGMNAEPGSQNPVIGGGGTAALN